MPRLCSMRPKGLHGLHGCLHRTVVLQKAMQMFESNSKDRGGSPYIQAKVLNAKDCLEKFQQGLDDADAVKAAATANEADKPR